MEPWFIAAILSAISAGLFSFSTKVSAHFRHHASQATFYSMLSAAVLSGIYAIATVRETHEIFIVLGLGLMNIIAYVILALTRIEALKSIDSTIYFPLYKVFTAILILPVGITLFQDTFTNLQILGVLLGASVPLLLVSKQESKRQINLKRGLQLIVIGVLMSIIVNVATKSIAYLELNMATYMFAVFAMGSVFAHYLYLKSKDREHTKTHVEWVGIIGGVLMYGNLYFYLHALEGNLTSVFIINSFSVVIAVFLSVLFFKEHINLRKIFALIGTICATVLLK